MAVLKFKRSSTLRYGGNKSTQKKIGKDREGYGRAPGTTVGLSEPRSPYGEAPGTTVGLSNRAGSNRYNPPMPPAWAQVGVSTPPGGMLMQPGGVPMAPWSPLYNYQLYGPAQDPLKMMSKTQTGFVEDPYAGSRLPSYSLGKAPWANFPMVQIPQQYGPYTLKSMQKTLPQALPDNSGLGDLGGYGGYGGYGGGYGGGSYAPNVPRWYQSLTKWNIGG